MLDGPFDIQAEQLGIAGLTEESIDRRAVDGLLEQRGVEVADLVGGLSAWEAVRLETVGGAK